MITLYLAFAVGAFCGLAVGLPLEIWYRYGKK